MGSLRNNTLNHPILLLISLFPTPNSHIRHNHTPIMLEPIFNLVRLKTLKIRMIKKKRKTIIKGSRKMTKMMMIMIMIPIINIKMMKMMIMMTMRSRNRTKKRAIKTILSKHIRSYSISLRRVPKIHKMRSFKDISLKQGLVETSMTELTSTK
jgi:hypothetical protein